MHFSQKDSSLILSADDNTNIVGNCSAAAEPTHTVRVNNVIKNRTKNETLNYDKKIFNVTKSGINTTYVCPNASNSSNDSSSSTALLAIVKTSANVSNASNASKVSNGTVSVASTNSTKNASNTSNTSNGTLS
jgi:hypothetical protein